jgi:type I restriction enzyme S subunit
MGIMKGYKQTDVGVIPNDWEVIKIGSACKLFNGRGFRPFEWKTEGLPIIRIQNLNGSNEYNYYEGIYDKKLEIKHGQLLFAWSGSRGTSFGPHIWDGPKGLLNYHTWKMVIDEEKIDKHFFTHSLKKLTKYIEDKAHGASALVHVQKWEMEGFKFPLPKNKKEQAAISTVLSDTDALISSLEKLIAKKRNIKQGATEELLKPKKGWEVKRLGEIGESIIGLTYTPDNVKDTGTLVLRSSNIQGGVLKYEDNVFVNSKVPDKLINRVNDILICVRNGSRNLIGKCALIQGRSIGETFGAFMAMYRSDYNRFIFHVFQSQVIKRQIDEHLGATINQITNKSLNGFEIPFPPLEQQKEIDQILSDMDAEINDLQSKLQKYRQIKSGMMQNLLTGKIRLI